VRRLSCGLLLLIWTPGAAQAQPVTAEEVLANHRRQVLAVTGSGRRAADCERAQDGDEIVVCGQTDHARHRLPLPVEPVPGAPRRIAGEPPTGTVALAGGGCLRLCHQPVQIDVIGAVGTAARAIGRLVDPDD